MVLKKLLLLIMLMCSVAVSACGSEPQKEAMPPATAVFETKMGNFDVALATDLAPHTCKNFSPRYRQFYDSGRRPDGNRYGRPWLHH